MSCLSKLCVLLTMAVLVVPKRAADGRRVKRNSLNLEYVN